jgi:hypothetical protein
MAVTGPSTLTQTKGIRAVKNGVEKNKIAAPDGNKTTFFGGTNLGLSTNPLVCYSTLYRISVF